MYNVACVKYGTKYGSEYVNKLFGAVTRNTTVPFTFHCFTDDTSGLNSNIVTHELPYTNVSGWWQKLYLFSNELNITGRMFFLDLDTLIVGNIDHYLTQESGFIVLRDLWAGGDNVGSAIMSFDIGKHTHIWETFIQNPIAAIHDLYPHGDQKWVQRQQPTRTYWQDIFPSEIVSFKSQCRNGIPPLTKIICFHGKPSIPEAIDTVTMTQGFVIPPTPWVKEHWVE